MGVIMVVSSSVGLNAWCGVAGVATGNVWPLAMRRPAHVAGADQTALAQHGQQPHFDRDLDVMISHSFGDDFGGAVCTEFFGYGFNLFADAPVTAVTNAANLFAHLAFADQQQDVTFFIGKRSLLF
jgi:hypothetical protein